jgi:proteasome lid subunit RPN8/RPN11
MNTDILVLTPHALETGLRAVRAAGAHECMGLLASRPGVRAVTEVVQLPAAASAVQAEAAPVAIKECMQRLLARGRVPRGLWHSHVGPVYHSDTDHATVTRWLPSMAAWNMERRPAPHQIQQPTLTGPDTARLPLADGHVVHFTLLGPSIPGLAAAHQRATWRAVSVDFRRAGQRPRATLTPPLLRLEAGGVAVSLLLPDGASITARREDAAPYRVARVYSLVINGRGETCAECLTTYEIGTECLTQQKPCAIRIAAPRNDGCRARPDANRPTNVGQTISVRPTAGQWIADADANQHDGNGGKRASWTAIDFNGS